MKVGDRVFVDTYDIKGFGTIGSMKAGIHVIVDGYDSMMYFKEKEVKEITDLQKVEQLLKELNIFDSKQELIDDIGFEDIIITTTYPVLKFQFDTNGKFIKVYYKSQT